MDAIAILDIGKTNTKVTLVADGRVIEQRRRHSESHPAPPYLHLANDRIWDWALEQLADLARQFNITDIVPVAHGASVAVIDDAGLVLPMLDYELDISDFDTEYDRMARDFAATGSPRLPCGHNTSRQLFWLQRKFPEQFARAKAIVGYAQYWSFLLSGVAANELTALGCHTDLWQPRAGDFSPLVDKAGWRGLMPVLRGAGDVLGPIKPEIAARTGLSPHCRVRCGKGAPILIAAAASCDFWACGCSAAIGKSRRTYLILPASMYSFTIEGSVCWLCRAQNGH